LYRIFASHSKGYGIHSPFVFRFVSAVLTQKDDSELLRIKGWRKSLYSEKETLETSDAGAGSKVHEKKIRTVRDIIPLFKYFA